MNSAVHYGPGVSWVVIFSDLKKNTQDRRKEDGMIKFDLISLAVGTCSLCFIAIITIKPMCNSSLANVQYQYKSVLAPHIPPINYRGTVPGWDLGSC